MPKGKDPLQGWSHRLGSPLHVAVISIIPVLVRLIVPALVGVEPEIQDTLRLVGAVELLPQFSLVPHLGDCPKT